MKNNLTMYSILTCVLMTISMNAISYHQSPKSKAHCSDFTTKQKCNTGIGHNNVHCTWSATGNCVNK